MSSKIDPSDICEKLISFVRKSNLNFHISESPFAVTINVKKTFIKDKNGVERLPVPCELTQSFVVKSECPDLLTENNLIKNTPTQNTKNIPNLSNTVLNLAPVLISSGSNPSYITQHTNISSLSTQAPVFRPNPT